MAAEIFMSCTCTSVVRGTAAGLCFLPSPRPRRSLSGTPSYLGQVKLRPASMGTQPCLPPWEHLHGLSPSYWGQADPPAPPPCFVPSLPHSDELHMCGRGCLLDPMCPAGALQG